MRRDDALRLLAEHRKKLRALGMASRRLFGSVARDEASPNSDIDVLVEVTPGRDLFDVAAIRLRLVELFGRQVDLAVEGGITPRYRARIGVELMPVPWESSDPG
ncbi:MAG: nucleotidyltransferase family protein [Chloroflexi bacterium]|nr:nucleotidyltransferase family protein [Chloroflexota bacterium]